MKNANASHKTVNRKGMARRSQWTLSKESELLTLYKVTSVVTKAKDLKTAYNTIARTVAQATDFEMAAVALLDSSARELEFAGQYHIAPPNARTTLRFPSEKTLSGVVTTTGKPLVIYNAFERKEYADPRLKKLRARTFVSVPLKLKGECIGAFSLATREDRIVSKGFVTFMMSLAKQISWLIDKKTAEERLRTSEEKYRQFFQGALDSILLIDPATGRIMDANPQAVQLTGRTHNELVGMNVYDLHPVPERVVSKRAFQSIRRKGALKNFKELHFAHKNGKVTPAEINARLVEIGGQQLVVGIVRDVADQKKAEVQLAASEELLRIIVEGTTDIIFYVHDTNGIFTYLSPSVEKITGHTVEDWKGHYTKFMTSNPINALVREHTERAINEGKTAPQYPCELLHKDGHPIILEVSEKPIFRDGRVIGIQGMARDITNRLQWEKNLRESEEKFRTLFHSVRDGIFECDVDGHFTGLNKAGAEILRYESAEEAIRTGANWGSHYVNLEDRLRLRARLAERGFVRNYEFFARRVDGETFYLETSATANFDEGGRHVGFDGTFRDVTEKKRLEEAILESREYLNRIIEQTPLAVEVFDAGGTLVDMNDAAIKLFEYASKEQIVGRFNVFKSGVVSHEPMAKALRDAFEGETVDVLSIPLRVSNASGLERIVHVKLFPVLDRSERLVNVVAMIEDITDRRRLEDQLIQSQKMESIGLLAGGIAHDFNNILGGILGYSSYLKTIVPKEDKITPHLETIERSALRAAGLTSQLLAFARRGKYDVKPIDVNAVVSETIRLLRGSLDRSIVVEEHLGYGLPATEADAGQMQQVIMNLCVNARDAMPGGGKLTITSEVVTEPDEFLIMQQVVWERAFVRISIGDTGVGIDKETLKRIFEPFFTTKEKGKGTGLGLATVYGIVKNHGGYIDVQSEVGEGTTFHIYLAGAAKKAVAIETGGGESAGGDERILIVDDEETIRSLARDILEGKGYSVLEAGNGKEALDVYTGQAKAVHLVILDMAMPVMGGSETFMKLREINPDVKVILSTGYSEDERARELLERGVKAFVQKPYRVNDLASVVRNVLDDKAILAGEV